MRSRRAFLGGAALLAASRAGATPPGDVPPPDPELARLKAENAALAAALGELEGRWAMATGAAEFRPKTLSAGERDRLKLPSLHCVDAPDHRGERRPAPTGRLVLTFWATWCKPCTTPDELLQLRALASRLARFGVPLLSLSADPLATVRSDPRAATWVYPYWQLEDAHLELLPQAFIQRRGLGLPLTLVLDGGRAVRWVRDGALGPDVLDELVLAALLSV